VLIARAFTGRQVVLKIAGGWHGSQPFALKGVSPRGLSFDHLESAGLSAGSEAEIALTRFNDLEDLRRRFAEQGDRIACFLVEPVLGAGGGFAASPDYLQEARRLTERHGALLVCDEIVTAFRYRAGDLSSGYGVRPDLWVLGKILGGGMPLAAVAGRRELLRLCARDVGRVKFEGGTYSAHELSAIAAATLLELLEREGQEIYLRLASLGARLAGELQQLAAEQGVSAFLPPPPACAADGASLVFVHPLRNGAAPPSCPEELAERRHLWVSERLLKSVLLLEGVSVRSGLGALSTEHADPELQATLEAYRAAFRRLRRAGLI
jgi:glutamate-1-semialdehyde 2,1-aminomutase